VTAVLSILVSLACAASITKYTREDYLGREWSKTRKLVLESHVTNGIWKCKYTGVTCSTKTKVDIDHIIPLKYAHDHGTYRLSGTAKHSFANDTLNLVEVSIHENRSKGDKGPSTYMPPQNACFYVSRWYLVSSKYKIKIDRNDSITLSQQRKNCK
jgi:hypothetical protein